MRQSSLLASASAALPFVALTGASPTAFHKTPAEAFSQVEGARLRPRADAPVMDHWFADPTVIEDFDGQWYAFATRVIGDESLQVIAAQAPASTGPWTYLEGVDLLPDSGAAFTGQTTWAPDVRRLDDSQTYVLYFSGAVPDTAFHCVGAATSGVGGILGPYTPQAEAFACPLDQGGAIDAGGFKDGDGRRYVAYKVDGNSMGNGGDCGNTVPPIVSTPIMLQEVDGSDGLTKIGEPVEILTNIESDGPYVEAPDIYLGADGAYYLFFSSGCFTTPNYNVNYARSTSGIRGPYERAASPLISSGDALGLTAPGGATTAKDGSGIVFHADCEAGRCMHAKGFSIADGVVSLV